MAHEIFSKPSVEHIDSLLNRADCIQDELLLLDERLCSAHGNETERRSIEATSSRLFWEMMSILYTVMDHCYYYLHCYFQHGGNHSFRADVSQIKTPVKLTLKWSVDSTRDKQVSRMRNAFVDEQCRLVFGEGYERDQRIRNSNLKWFQQNILSLQAVIEIDKAGTTVQTCPQHGQKCPQDGTCLNKAPNLLRAVRFCYEPFNPTRIQFEKLESVANIADWSDTTVYNLLHFFRNLTSHRCLIPCRVMNVYLNATTNECKVKADGEDLDGVNNFPWVYIGRFLGISVPEITHLRDGSRRDRNSVRCYPHPLTMVCGKILNFVQFQRFNLLK